MADFEIGDIVKGKKFGPLEHEFSGVVEKVYTNSIMVSIQDFDPSELNGRAVIRQKEAKMVKAVPREEKKDDEETAEDAKSSKKS